MITAREALDRATGCAERGDIARGTLWLGIARELREDAWMRASTGGVKLGIGDDPEEWLASNTRTPSGEQAYRPEQVRVGYDAVADQLVTLPAPEPAHRRAETEVIQRTPDETTPVYEAAGESLGNTVSIPITVAHPQPHSQGPNSTCVNCGEDVFWERGSGWMHDRDGLARCRPVSA